MDFPSLGRSDLMAGMVTPPRTASPNRNNSAISPKRGSRRNTPTRVSRKPKKSHSRKSSRSCSPYRTTAGETVSLNESFATTDAWSDSDTEKKEEKLPSINERLGNVLATV